MADEIQALIDSLRRGQYENPAEKISLLSAALQEQKADVALLVSLLRAPQIPLCLAAIDACRERKEPEILTVLAGLTEHVEQRIRLKLAEIFQYHSSAEAVKALHTLVKDAEESVRAVAMKSASGRPEFRTAQETALAKDNNWNVRLAAVNALETQKTPHIVKPLFEALIHDRDEDVRQRCAEIIEKRLLELSKETERYLPSEIARLTKIEKSLKQLGAHRFPTLIAWISARTTVTVDPAVLAKFGTDLTELAKNGTLPRAYGYEEYCESLLRLIQRESWRSLLLLGPAGVGKSALVNELVYHLAKPENGAWRVLRISPADFMSGTKYLGEWETKVKEVVEAIKKPRRVLLYVPNISDLAAAGTWSKSDSSVATALAPYLDEGSVLLLGESAPEEFERGLGRIPPLARLFDKVLLHEPDPKHTLKILTAVRAEEKSSMPDEVLDQVMELSAQFLSHISRPGNAVELLKAAIKNEKELGRTSTFRDALNLLSKSTGVPAQLLDDAVPLNLAAVREFFEKRIVGQSEAVEAVVDLVTLIKAGLTDPNKPFGVFLFVGPTGVGKTELARALAEFIFGDAARLKRFDMSEFAGADGFTRLIGGNRENGLLTDAVRQHPFSVVLLDEIEKAHVNVFDLCLQIFDAGRLTDGRGRTTDFRRTIVILTSNIGAQAASTPLGFGASAASQPTELDKDRTFRELSRFFRPEFLNRLDRIVQFRPLSLQVAEQIARREIDIVLQRSGVRRRQLIVDIDPAVVSLLVREGYSPHFGARPLKRTVERLLLLPLARAISSGSLRGRTILRLTERNGGVEAVFTATPAKEAKSQTVVRANSGLDDQLAKLQKLYLDLETTVQPLSDRKSELIIQSQQPNFFNDVNKRSLVLGEIHNLDQFLHLYQWAGKALNGMEERFHRSKLSKADESAFRRHLDRLTGEIEHLSFVSRCTNSQDIGDALIVISLIDRNGSAQGAVQKIAGMYQSLAGRKRMTAEILGEFYDGKQDRVYLLVAGLGAYALLKNESGLHQVDRRFKERAARSGREVFHEDRELVRVEVHSAFSQPPKQLQQRVKSKVSTLKPVKKRLLNADLAVSVFDEQAVRSIEFWTNGPKEEALERCIVVLHATADSKASLENIIVRHYDVGIAPKIKDARTGNTTTHIEKVFDGELDLFLGRVAQVE